MATIPSGNINPGEIGRVRIKEESAYTDLSTSGWTHTVQCEVPDLRLERQIFERVYARGGFETAQPVNGPERPGITLRFINHGWTSAAVTAIPTDHPPAMFARSVLGASVQGGYIAGAVAEDSAVGAIKVDAAADLSLLKPGSFLAMLSGTAYQIGRVKTKTDNDPADDDLTWLLPTESIPTTGATIFGSNTAYLTLADLIPPAFTIEFQPLNAENRIILGGCTVESFTTRLTPGGEIECEVTFQANESDLTAGEDLTSFAVPYPWTPPLIGDNSARLVIGDGSTGADYLDVHDLEVKMSQVLKETRGHGASQGRRRLVAVSRMVEISYSTEVTDSHLVRKALEAMTPMQFSVGNTIGNLFAWAVPAPIHVGLGGSRVEDDRHMQSWTIRPGYYAGDGASTDAGNSFFSMGWM